MAGAETPLRKGAGMYKVMASLYGVITDVNVINEKIADLTGDSEPLFDPETEEWRAWVEYSGGRTNILTEEA